MTIWALTNSLKSNYIRIGNIKFAARLQLSKGSTHTRHPRIALLEHWLYRNLQDFF